MPYYSFSCAANHRQELKLSFADHKSLAEDKLGPYVECNVKYGELGHPVCGQRAHQEFSSNVVIDMNYGPEGRH
jgi:hypothetical protein